MEWYFIVLIGILVLLVFGVIPLLILGLILYRILLVRTKPEKWMRGPSMPENEEYMKLFTEGQKWREAHLDRKKDVHIVNEGLNLYGEYFDFGADKAVIILPGRMETCLYGCFFAAPYEEAGLNVLTIDPRAHGKSDGRYNSLGFTEYSDVIAWAKMLHDTLGNRSIWLHGVCIGSSAAAFTLTAPACPEYIRGMTGEGMYRDFLATFKTHLEHQGHRYFPIGPMTVFWMRALGKADVKHDGPKKRLPMLKKPILMLHSREDIYSLPAIAEEMYASVTAKKQMVWFETGGHSMIRIHTEENRIRYDESIKAFIQQYGN